MEKRKSVHFKNLLGNVLAKIYVALSNRTPCMYKKKLLPISKGHNQICTIYIVQIFYRKIRL